MDLPFNIAIISASERLHLKLSPARRQGKNDFSVYQQNPPPNPSRDNNAHHIYSFAFKYSLLEQPGDLRMVSHSRASSEVDLDESASQLDYAQGSADWGPQPKLPTHKPIPERGNLGGKQTDRPSLSCPKPVPYSKQNSARRLCWIAKTWQHPPQFGTQGLLESDANGYQDL